MTGSEPCSLAIAVELSRFGSDRADSGDRQAVNRVHVRGDLANALLTTALENGGRSRTPGGTEMPYWPLRRPRVDGLGLAKPPENRTPKTRGCTSRAEAVQHESTATPPTASDSIGPRPTTDLPQRPPATSAPRVRIEGVKGSNPLSSTKFQQVRVPISSRCPCFPFPRVRFWEPDGS